jgi:hypothetical protein
MYSTYLGGGAVEIGRGIAVDTEGNVYVTGQTGSVDFPTQNPLYGSFTGGFTDAFVTKISTSGSALIYSTYLGGSSYDYGFGIAVDALGNAYVTGNARSTNFPTQNPFQPYSNSNGSYYNGFVTKFSRAGNEVIYSTYLGGSFDDGCYGIAVGASDNAYVTGWASSADFPTQNPYQSTFGGGLHDVFVTKLGVYPCCTGTTGNVNLTGIVDLADLTALVRLITYGDYPITCMEAVNVNAVGSIDLSDLSALVSYLTGAGYALPNCP